MLLSDISAVPHTYSLSPSKLRYWNSLVPEYCILENIKKITIVESFFTDKPADLSNWAYVKHQNSINTHLFKPRYYVNKVGDELIVYCASKEIIAHTVRALSVVASCMYYPNITVEIGKEPGDIADLDFGELKKNVLVCRIPSYLDFMKILYLLRTGVPKSEVKKHFIAKELARLNSSLQSSLDDHIEKIGGKTYDFEKIFKLKIHKTKSPYFFTASLVFDEKEISLLQLPWGITLSESMLERAFESNGIKKLGFVGGAGCIGKNHGSVDDAFYVNNIVLGNDYDGYEIKEIDNSLLKSPDNTYFTDKNVVHGNIKTVTPKLGALSTTAQYKNGMEFIFAFDMEFEGFYKAFKNKKIEVGAVHYYMDKENVGVELGDTYYYEPFLRDLLSNFNRGKYFCFEKVTNWLLAD